MPQPSYNPVPSNTYRYADDRPSDRRPLSPGAQNSHFFESETDPLAQDGYPRPRFMGPAADDGQDRTSFASSHISIPSTAVEEYSSSVYALNDGSQKDSFYNFNYHDDPHDADFNASEQTIGAPKAHMRGSPYLEEKRGVYASPSRSRRKAIIIGCIVAFIAIAVAVVVAVYFAIVKPNSNKSSVSGAAASGAAAPSSTASSGKGSTSGSLAVVTGGDGSTVTMDDGSTFTYQNSFGGYWYYDPSDPFVNAAKAQSWSPALNETFNYGVDPIRGVNLGGWLVTEPFIVPALYEKYVNTSTPAVDEWTLSEAMAADTASGGLQQLEDHYNTFITEKDFAAIAAAGLNFVRIPIPYWAIEVRENEPFLPKVAWTYFLKAIEWARKYGLRINLDLHALPGSQNGWNHSGRVGTINVLDGPMGYANAQRALDYIRIIAEFISQPQYENVVVMFGITNEPWGPTIGQENLARYYLEAYNLVRQAGGTGAGNGPFISYHDGFLGLPSWAGWFPNSDRTSLDIHQYMCFSTQSADPYSARLATPCTTWATGQNASMSAFGLTATGEWSNAINDCGLWVNGVNLGARYDGTYTAGSFPFVGNCSFYTNYQQWNDSMKADIQQFALASMSALQNWFFWTWKIGNSSVSGLVESPAWSYSLGLQEGWMPLDPRGSEGICENSQPFSGPLQSWQTGGAGANQIPASISSSYAWPPTSITNGGFVTSMPSYTPTGAIVTLPVPTFTSSVTVSAGVGWVNTADTALLNVPIATCGYLDPWMGQPSTSVSPCPAPSGNTRRRWSAPEPVITSPPSL